MPPLTVKICTVIYFFTSGPICSSHRVVARGAIPSKFDKTQLEN